MFSSVYSSLLSSKYLIVFVITTAKQSSGAAAVPGSAGEYAGFSNAEWYEMMADMGRRGASGEPRVVSQALPVQAPPCGQGPRPEWKSLPLSACIGSSSDFVFSLSLFCLFLCFLFVSL